MEDPLYDVFVSHASEDKEDLVFPLVDELKALGVRVWYDEFVLDVGDSLSRAIDKGLSASSFGIVVISPNFLRKGWPEYELRGLVSKEMAGGKTILPIWHNVSHADVVKYSPTLADKVALTTVGDKRDELARRLVKVIRPDIYQHFLRTALARIESLRNTKKIPVHLIKSGEARHATLPQVLVSRAIVVHAITEDVLPMSLKETLYSFRCDSEPEREISIWERIAACYYIATTGESYSLAKRKEIFGVLLAASLGPSPEKAVRHEHLTHEEFNSVVALYDSDLSSVEIH